MNLVNEIDLFRFDENYIKTLVNQTNNKKEWNNYNYYIIRQPKV